MNSETEQLTPAPVIEAPNPPDADESSEIKPRDLAVRYLTNPKAKLSGRVRRRFKALLDKPSPYVPQEAKPWNEKADRTLKALPLHRLIRRMKSYARHSAHCAHLLKQLDPQSRFRAPIEARSTFFACLFRKANEERMARAQRCSLSPSRCSLPLKVQKRLAAQKNLTVAVIE
jgi:hypothetical protein